MKVQESVERYAADQTGLFVCCMAELKEGPGCNSAMTTSDAFLQYV